MSDKLVILFSVLIFFSNLKTRVLCVRAHVHVCVCIYNLETQECAVAIVETEY